MSNIQEIILKINDTPRSITVGEQYVLTFYGQEFGTPDETIAEVAAIENSDDPSEAEIILKKHGAPHQNWEEGHWLTLWVEDFLKMFSKQVKCVQVVNRNYMYRKQNLKGVRCRIIAKIDQHDVFVEMENNIGGGSCDGTGMSGHCIPIKKEFLTSSSEKSKKAEGG